MKQQSIRMSGIVTHACCASPPDCSLGCITSRRQGWFAAGLYGALFDVGGLGLGVTFGGRAETSFQDSHRAPDVNRIVSSSSSLTRIFFRANDYF